MSHDPAAFVRNNTAVLTAPLVPEIRLHLASEVVPLWQMTEVDLEATGLPPPYWAFAWAGGQALARHILDNPVLVRGRRVLDFASGSGIVGIAAMMAGARSCVAADIDVFAAAACQLNAAENGVALSVTDADLIGTDGDWETVFAGDICYERPLAARVEAWLKGLAKGNGRDVLIGDPGRTYLPKAGLTQLAVYAVQTSRELEDLDVRHTKVWRVTA